MVNKKTSKADLPPTHGAASISPEPSARLLDDIRAILRQARRQAYASANAIMVEAYWRIGQRIVEEEQGGKNRADYGAFLIRGLARQLGEEFGRGLSVANLWNFRQFYLTFPSEEKLYALRRELTWTHWRLLMRVDDPKERDYYIGECANQGWTTRQLERNMASGMYRRQFVRSAQLFARAVREIDRDGKKAILQQPLGEFGLAMLPHTSAKLAAPERGLL